MVCVLLVTATSNPPQEAPQNWGGFVPGLTVHILKGNKQQHSSWINLPLKGKEEATRGEMKLVPTSDAVAVLVVPSCLHHWMTKPTLSGMKGPRQWQKYTTTSINFWNLVGKRVKKEVRTYTKLKYWSSPLYKKLVPTTEWQRYLLYIPFVPTLGNLLRINSAIKSCHYKSITKAAQGMQEKTAKTWSTPRHKRTTREFSHQQKEFLPEKCIRNSRGKNW